MKKLKLIITSSTLITAILLNTSTEVNALTNNSENTIINKAIAAPPTSGGGVIGHTMVSTKSYVISIKQQNRQQAALELATTLAGGGLAKWGLTTTAKVIGAFGSLSTVSTLFTGDSGAQYPILVKETYYKANKPTSTYGGFVEILMYNKTTGKYLTTKKTIVGKTGV